MHQSNLLRVADRVGLAEIDLDPAGGDWRGRVGWRGRSGEDRIGNHRGDTAADNVREEVAAVRRIEVDETVDRKADLAGRVPVVRVLDNTRRIGRVREPNAELLEVTRLAARQRQGERAIRRTGREGEADSLLRPALAKRNRQSMLGHVKPPGDKITGILHRHLREIHSRILEARGDRVGTRRRLRDHTAKVLKIDLELDRGCEDIRRERERTTRQRR